MCYLLNIQSAKQLIHKKEEGNAAFKIGRTEEAYKLYSEALAIDPNNIFTNSKLYFNRATVCSKVITAFSVLFGLLSLSRVRPLSFCCWGSDGLELITGHCP